MNVDKAKEYCKSIDCEKNESGNYIYDSRNNKHGINLPYILDDYLQYISEPTKEANTSEKATDIITGVRKQSELFFAVLKWAKQADLGYPDDMLLDDFKKFDGKI